MLGGTLVYIDGNPLDEALIERLTVTQALGEHWWCDVRFRQTKDHKPPCEEALGKPLRVVTQDENGTKIVIFGGFIIEAERSFEIWGSSGARLRAVTLSYLLELTPRRAYFLRQSPQDVAAKIMGRHGLDWTSQLNGGPLSYVQQGETDFSFLLRLADDDEKWIRPTWTGLEARDSFADGVTVQWRAERGLLGFAVAGRIATKAFSGWHYDYRKMESLTVEKASSDTLTLGSAGKMFQAANRVAQQFPPAYDPGRGRLMGIDDVAPQLQKESRRSLANAVVCRGTSLEQRLKAGDKVTIQGPFDASGDYGLISVSHVWTAAGYENQFVCTPAAKFTHAAAPRRPTLYGVYRARVADNNDPQGLGRLQIQFFWQEENQSCWVRAMTPYAGADYGVFVLPEIGDEVWVMFEEGDPERPRVIGSAWNGLHKPPREQFWGGDVDPNYVKRIVTKSGHRITLSDKPDKNSIVIATPNHLKLQMIEGSNETSDSMLALHSDGDILLSAPNGRVHFHCKAFSREVGAESAPAIGGAALAPQPGSTEHAPPNIPIEVEQFAATSQSQSTSDSMSISREQALKDVLSEAKQRQIQILTDADPEIKAYMDNAGARQGIQPASMHAITLSPDTIVIRQQYANNVRVLREEMIHTQQQAEGITIEPGSDLVTRMELDARRQLLANSKKWALTPEEIDEIQREIRLIIRRGKY